MTRNQAALTLLGRAAASLKWRTELQSRLWNRRRLSTNSTHQLASTSELPKSTRRWGGRARSSRTATDCARMLPRTDRLSIRLTLCTLPEPHSLDRQYLPAFPVSTCLQVTASSLMLLTHSFSRQVRASLSSQVPRIVTDRARMPTQTDRQSTRLTRCMLPEPHSLD